MLDIRRIRQEPELIKAGLKRRGQDYSNVIDQVLELDEQRRVVRSRSEEQKTLQNQLSKQIPAIKKSGGNTEELTDRLRELSEQIYRDYQALGQLEEQISTLLAGFPNLPHPSVPDGVNAADNQVVREWGTAQVFPYPPKSHWEIGSDLGLLEPERAGKVTGKRFHFMRGIGAKLERALANYFLDCHNESGYEEMQPPYLVNESSLYGTGQLPRLEADMFRTSDGLFLIPTAEVPLTNFYRDEILDVAQLPVRMCAYSACFRAEVGAAGRDTRGLIRQHQFGKVELVKLTRPEDSDTELESLTADAEQCLQGLGLAYRVVNLCAGDLGFTSAKTYDLEVWMPSYNRYIEISSCSNCGDYQARRMAIRLKDQAGGKARLVHTLNGSALAVGRTVAAILENYQNDDGSVTVPEVLRPYLGCDQIR